MRIISQDGTIDIPYEHICISISKDNACEIIAWHSLATDENCVTMANYSTEEKVKKAMDMLHKKYESVSLTENIGSSSEFQHALVNMDENLYKKITSMYFQFPKDEDV